MNPQRHGPHRPGLAALGHARPWPRPWPPAWALACTRHLGLVLLLALAPALGLGPPASAQAATADTPMTEPAVRPAAGQPAADTQEAVLALNNRRIATFRAPLLGDSPAERAALAHEALEAAVARGGPGVVSRSPAGEAVRFELDGAPLFYLVAEDLNGPRPAAMLDGAAMKVEHRLKVAVRDAREIADPKRLAIGAASALAASAVAYALLRGLLAGRRRLQAGLDRRLARWQQPAAAAHPAGQVISAYAQHAQGGAQWLATGLAWALGLLVLDVWATFVLRQFAYTRPWGEQATTWLMDLLERLALGTAGAVPGLLTALLIFALARLVTRANTVFMQRVERGELQLGWLDLDTAGPTRRLGNVVVWLFALAMAYPYLPGSDSEAFKGVSVLAGLMLSLGASGMVGQAMAGLSLMYARALRVGEYVKVGDTEGTVTAVGLFVTKVHTGLGEEVSLPSALVLAQPVRNFSRLVQADGQFMLHTGVTIGYATPWRQVHAMLLEAARRTPGVAAEPAPYVVQTALSDFYVEYRLCCQGNRSAPRRRAEALNQLHGHIQDVFNENGVQIMSPHYRGDPEPAQVVAPGPWFVPEGAPLTPQATAPSAAQPIKRPDGPASRR